MLEREDGARSTSQARTLDRPPGGIKSLGRRGRSIGVGLTRRFFFSVWKNLRELFNAMKNWITGIAMGSTDAKPRPTTNLGVAQVVEHRAWDADVVGSRPAAQTSNRQQR